MSQSSRILNMLNHKYLNEKSDLKFDLLGVIGNLFIVEINGNRYTYSPNEGMTIKELDSKVRGIYKHSPGRALAFLKKNSKLESGSIKNKSRFVEFLNKKILVPKRYLFD